MLLFNCKSHICFILIFSALCIENTWGWDSEQLEVFDVVDAVKINFYDLLNISKDASSSEIRSAFRVLSLKLHPDKNLDVDTSEDFRNLVSVYDILKSPSKRKYYDEVLVNGLPNWRSAVYYYRYVRKVGMAEACIILFVLVTIGQYAVNWAAYFERKFTIQENTKKRRGRKPKNAEEEPPIDLPKPSFIDTLPFQLPKLLWVTVMSIPSAVDSLKSAVAHQIVEATKVSPEPEPEPVKIKTVRKRNKFIVPEGPNFETETTGKASNSSSDQTSPPPVSGGLWTDDDLDELIRLVKKYPQGCTGRWENIAEALGRSIPEVTHMANKMKNIYKPPTEREEETPQIKVKQKTKKSTDVSGDNITKWTQVQQKSFEEALGKYPKGVLDRWDKIANCVPEKTKDECVLRFKYLSEMVKKQKESASDNNSTDVQLT